MSILRGIQMQYEQATCHIFTLRLNRNINEALIKILIKMGSEKINKILSNKSSSKKIIDFSNIE